MLNIGKDDGILEIEYGKPYKYREMLSLMEDIDSIDLSNGSGQQRKLQLKRWQQYYDIEKVGYKFIIHQKYNENEINLIENHGKFTSYINDMLISILSKSDNPIITISYNKLFKVLYMVTDYYKNRYKIDDELKEINISILDNADSDLNVYELSRLYHNEWHSKAHKILKDIVDNALISMRKRKCILLSYTFILYKIKHGIDKDTKQPYVYSKEVHITLDEAQEILEKENQIIKSLNIKRSQLFYKHTERKIFRDAMLQYIKERFDCDNYTEGVTISISKTGLEMNLSDLKYVNPKKLNNNLVNKFLNGADMKEIPPKINKAYVDRYIKLPQISDK